MKAALLGQWWWQFTVSASAVLLIGLIWLADGMARRSLEKSKRAIDELDHYFPKSKPSTVNWDLVRRNYPDVPTYPTKKEALAQHPLTPPPPPNPTDEDFWTREVPR